LNQGWTLASYVTHNENFLVERDRRYQERFSAQQHAVELALSRVDIEFHEHLRQYQTEIKAALDAAEKAIGKSEAAYEKRFEAVNEFRQTLSDQAATFMPRTEALQRADTNADKIDGLASRMDRIEATKGGADANWTKLGGFVAVGVGLLTILGAIIAATLYLANVRK